MEIKHYEQDGLCLSYVEASGADADAPVVHFAHANGFNAGVYEPLIDDLSDSARVLGLNICGQSDCGRGVCEKSRRIKSWHGLASELGGFLKSVSGGARITGVGHSIGGVVTLLCAVKHPELFSKIILLDPVLIDPGLVRFIFIMNLIGKQSRAPLAVRARKRRNGWESREEALEYFRARPLFEGWRESTLQAYVKYGLKESPGGGVELACPPEIEAQGFQTYPWDIWRQVRRLRTPCVLVRGEKSDTFTPLARDLFLRLRPEAAFSELPDAGHLFPMQQPDTVVRIIKENI